MSPEGVAGRKNIGKSHPREGTNRKENAACEVWTMRKASRGEAK